jgi:hypothetical protein
MVWKEQMPNSALLTDAFSSLRCACGAAKRERELSLSTLAELADVQQDPRGPRRRWFRSSNEDLIVWCADDDLIIEGG